MHQDSDIRYWAESIDAPIRLARCSTCGRWVCRRRHCRKAWAVR